jgi:hypothetical protein
VITPFFPRQSDATPKRPAAKGEPVIPSEVEESLFAFRFYSRLCPVGGDDIASGETVILVGLPASGAPASGPACRRQERIRSANREIHGA